MAIRIFLDDTDITADLAAQHALPTGPYDGIYPGKGRNEFFDLLPCIAAHPELKANFFNDSNALHNLTIQDDSNTEITVRLLLSMKYSSRNR